MLGINEIDIIIKYFLTALGSGHIGKVASACYRHALRHGTGKRRRNALAAHRERRQRTVRNGVERIVCPPTLRKGAERKEAKQGGNGSRPNGMERHRNNGISQIFRIIRIIRDI